jgi:hypothetical protein
MSSASSSSQGWGRRGHPPRQRSRPERVGQRVVEALPRRRVVEAAPVVGEVEGQEIVKGVVYLVTVPVEGWQRG